MATVPRTLVGRDLLSLLDLTPAEIRHILDVASALEGTQSTCLEGKTLALIFRKPSTRTRVSFEVAMLELGGRSLFLPASEMQLSRGEPIEDTASVLSRYVQGIVMRTYAHQELVTLADYADVPVINALTDSFHPCQVLADLYALRAVKPDLEHLKIAFFGEAHNVARSWMVAASKLGLNFWIAGPNSLGPDEEFLAQIDPGCLTVTEDAQAAAAGADVLITDTWFSMGSAEETDKKELLAPYQVNAELAAHAHQDYAFMHCLPAHRGEEVTAEILDGAHSLIWDEAAARLHVQKALLSLTLGGDKL